MKTFRVAMIYFILSIFQGVCLSYSEPVSFMKQNDCFDYAESVTGFSAEILRGIAATESHFRENAVGDAGMSLGMFQLNSRWHESRAEKWGEFDPVDPFNSAVIAGWIMQENLNAFDGDLRMAIAAYRQGVSGVLKYGVDQWYVDSVLNWKADPEKAMSFLIFIGITSDEVLQNGYKGTGEHNKYQFDDFFAPKISRRGSCGFSYQE